MNAKRAPSHDQTGRPIRAPSGSATARGAAPSSPWTEIPRKRSVRCRQPAAVEIRIPATRAIGRARSSIGG